MLEGVWPPWLTGNVAMAIKVAILLFATILGAKLVNKLMHDYLEKSRAKLMINETIFRLAQHFVIAAIYFLGIISIFSVVPQLNSVSIALVTGAGLAGVVVGLAAQNTLGNVISGISLAIFQPFRVGDSVTVHKEYGTVTDLGLRHTVITTWDNRRLLIPNSIISNEAIINWSIEDPTIIWPVNIGISYDSDINLARSIMLEEAKKNPSVMGLNDIRMTHPEVAGGNEMKVLVTELGDFAVNLRLQVWMRDRAIAYTTGCELLEAIKKRFDAEGVEIPFPYRTIVYKKDLPPNVSIKAETEVTGIRGGEVHFQDDQSGDSDSNNQ